MKKRATIVLSGEVQDVGFRGTVMRMGQKAGLVGFVENLPDGTVRAVCEGESKTILGFLKKLKIDDGDIRVKTVAVKWSKALGKFKYFEVQVTNVGDEMFQGFATAGRMLNDVKNEVKIVAKNVDGVKTEVKAMHTDINQRFDTLESRYGEIGQDIKTGKTDMAKLTAELHNSTEALISITQKVGALIDRKLAE